MLGVLVSGLCYGSCSPRFVCFVFLQLGHCCYGFALGFQFHNGDCLCALLVLGAVD